MQDILSNHQKSLNIALLKAGNELLLKLADEPQYQIMTQNVLTNMEKRYNQRINDRIMRNELFSNIEKKCRQSIKDRFNQQDDIIDWETNNLKLSLNKFNEQQQILSKKIESLECEFNNKLTTYVGILCLTSIFFLGIYMSYDKNDNCGLYVKPPRYGGASF